MKKKCHDCRRLARPGRRRCAVCAKAHAAREMERRNARREQGRCVICGEPGYQDDEGTQTLCQRHREAFEERRAARRAVGET